MDEQIDESVLCLELGSEESTKRMDAFDYFKPISIPYQKSKVDYNQFGRVNNYLKGCKWAPDGTCLISWSNDQQVRLFNLPTDLWQPPIDESKINQSSDDLLCALTIQESGLIYDACFNPIMNSNEPETCL